MYTALPLERASADASLYSSELYREASAEALSIALSYRERHLQRTSVYFTAVNGHRHPQDLTHLESSTEAYSLSILACTESSQYVC